jgi:amino acid transporter
MPTSQSGYAPISMLIAILLLSIFLTINSIKRSVLSNKTAWEAILSVFAKYALLALITLCALIAVGGALAAVEEVKKKRYKQAAANAAQLPVER